MRRAAFALVQVLCLAALAWPLVFGVRATDEALAHSRDAPMLVIALVPLLLLVALREVRGGDARMIALLGALCAMNAVLRIPKGVSGEGFMFVLPLLAGWAIGPVFGFLLGAFSLLLSAVITAGIGPWLPFQMFGLGWVGMGAGLLRHATRGRLSLVTLGAWAVACSFVYGAIMTLWFWPFLRGTGPTFYSPGPDVLLRFARFYALSSGPWDMSRALLSNLPLTLLLARPVGRLLDRARERFTVVWAPAEAGR